MASLPTSPGTSIFAWKISSGGADTWTLDPVSPADLPDGATVEAVTISVSEAATIVNDVAAAKVGTPQSVSENQGTQVSINFAPLFAGTNLVYSLDPVPTGWSIDATGLATGPIFTGTVTAKATNSLPAVASQSVAMTAVSSVPTGFTAVNTNDELITAVNADPSGKYYLTFDPDLSAYPSWNELDVDFYGVIDGGGHVVRGLTINSPGGFLDGFVKQIMAGGIIRNLGFESVSINAGRMVGAVAGRNYGRIENAWATGTISGDRAELGGITGILENPGAIVDNCWTDVDVSQSGSESKFVGGIVGGWISGSVRNSYALGTVASTSSGGGGLPGPICGDTGWGGENVFFDTETTGFASDPHGTAVGLTTAEMQAGDASIFTNWSETAWQFVAGHYPVLAWQATPSPSASVQTQTILPTDPLILDSPDASTPVLPAFDLSTMKEGDANAWAIPLLWFRRPGESANAELFRLEVPGTNQYLSISGQGVTWRNSTTVSVSTSDEATEGAWNLVFVQVQHGSYAGVRISINGGPFSNKFDNNGDKRFMPTRLQVSAVLSEVGFLLAPWDAANQNNPAPFWNAGAPGYVDQVDLSATSMSLLDHFAFYRAAGETEVVDWASAPHPEFGAATGPAAFWWDLPTHVESMTWTAPTEPKLPSASSFQIISPYTETLVKDVPFKLRAMHVFNNSTGLSYTGSSLAAQADPEDPESLILTASAVQAATEEFIKGTSKFGETAEKGFRFQVIDPPPLALSATPLPDYTLADGEVGPPHEFWRHVQGGARPYRFEVVSGPSSYRLKSWGLGKPIGSSADLGTMELRVRCTDARGETKDIVCQATTLAQRDRTTDRIVIPTSETDLASFLNANAASGRCIIIPRDFAIEWSNVSVPAIPLGQAPCIIRGEDKATSVLVRMQVQRCQNYRFENLTCKGHGSNANYGGIGTMNALEDVRFEGRSYQIDPSETYVDPSDGQTKNKWYITDPSVDWQWQNGGFVGSGGSDLVLNRVEFYGFKEALKIDEAERITLQDVTITHVSMDAFKLQGVWGVIMHRCRARKFDGNASREGDEHRDLCQFVPGSKYGQVWVEKVELVAEVPQYDAQGFFQSQHGGRDYPVRGYVNADEGPSNGSYPGFSFEDVAVFSGSSTHGFTLAGQSDFLLKKAIVVRHPAWGTEQTRIFWNEPVTGTIADALYHEYMGRTSSYKSTINPGSVTKATVQRRTFEKLSNNVPYSEIFPNWDRTDMLFETPVDAVEAGADPSQARLWMDPNSAWAQANPTIGPSFMKDGIW